MKFGLLCGFLVVLCVVRSVTSAGCTSGTCDANTCECKAGTSDCGTNVECVKDATDNTKCICKCKKDIDESGCVESNLNYLLNLLNGQLRVEYHAMFAYSQLASFCGSTSVAKLGFQKKWLHAAAEEKEHADMITQYINLRGGHANIVGIKTVNLGDLKKDLLDLEKFTKVNTTEINNFFKDTKENTKLVFSDLKKTFDPKASQEENTRPAAKVKDTVAFAKILEIYVYKKILHIRQQAEDYKEFHLADWLDRNLIQEQVDSIYELSVLETRIVDDTLSVLLIDQELNK